MLMHYIPEVWTDCLALQRFSMFDCCNPVVQVTEVRSVSKDEEDEDEEPEPLIKTKPQNN